MNEYAESHQNPLNIKIHWACVPLIMLSILSLLSYIPIGLPYLDNVLNLKLNNLSFILIITASIYYFHLSKPLFIGMIPITFMMVLGIELLDNALVSKFYLSILIFTIAWIGQFYGHKVEGKKPSFFKDIQFLLIGPLWLLSKIYRHFGISY